MYKVKIILDSINARGHRLTSFLLTYPLNVHAELMTHRIFSRNAASARAVPIQKFIEAVENDPVLPVVWRENQKGMEAAGNLPEHIKNYAAQEILTLRRSAINTVKILQGCNLHKSWVNRYLQPWMWITTLVTSCDYGNWFSLRADSGAQPEIMVPAFWMLREYSQSKPKELNYEEWHIPGINPDEVSLPIKDRLAIATARAARTSYTKFEEPISLTDALRIEAGLIMGGHWSPFEHCAQAISEDFEGIWKGKDYPWSNFDVGGTPSGWGQYRKSFAEEFRKPTTETLQSKLDQMPDWVYNVIQQCSR